MRDCRRALIRGTEAACSELKALHEPYDEKYEASPCAINSHSCKKQTTASRRCAWGPNA